MKVTVDIPEKDLADIMRYSGEKKKGPAIVKFLTSGLMLRRRRELTEEIVSGKWVIDLPDWRITRARERDKNSWAR
ncbi:MAG TPA: hypothetical protein VIS74_05780 [Chthoniobacterales bacterium]